MSREGDLAQAVCFLPGFPDGSFGWVKVRSHLPNAAEMRKLFVDYVGMGDSDKPWDYASSTAKRTDLLEAIWRDRAVPSTTLVGFDFSSLVIFEHLRRRLGESRRLATRQVAGEPSVAHAFDRAEETMIFSLSRTGGRLSGSVPVAIRSKAAF